MGMRPYLVRQGDYLDRLAYQQGFDAGEVWNDDRNRALREARPDPNQLAPGDLLYVPDRPSPATAAIRPHQQNRYSASVPKVRVGVRLSGPGGDGAFAGEPYVVEGLGAPIEGTADGDGRVTLEVPLHVTEVHVVFARLGVSMPVRVGHLDPIDVESGVRARLAHLEHGQAELGDALRAFQREQGLAETGTLDTATRDALRDAHAV